MRPRVTRGSADAILMKMDSRDSRIAVSFSRDDDRFPPLLAQRIRRISIITGCRYAMRYVIRVDPTRTLDLHLMDASRRFRGVENWEQKLGAERRERGGVAGIEMAALYAQRGCIRSPFAGFNIGASLLRRSVLPL